MNDWQNRITSLSDFAFGSKSVRPDGAIHLDAKPAVYLDSPLVVDPGNAELNHPLRLNKTFKDLAVSIFLIPLNGGFD
jgi:hypothetical protein